MNKDQTRGRIERANGRAQEIIGRVRGDKGQELKGKLHKDLGTAQALYGDLQENIKKAKPHT